MSGTKRRGGSAPAERVVVITGGSRGIGRAIAVRLLADGLRVACCARRPADLEALNRQIESKYPGRLMVQACDVRDRDAVGRFLDAVLARFGRIDVLVHSAGVGRFGRIDELSLVDWQELIDVDLTGSFNVFQQALARMRRRSPPGYILTIGSLCNEKRVGGSAAYASAKAAQRVLADYLFEETRAAGLLSTCLAIGSVATDFSRRTTNRAWKIRPDEVARAVQSLLELATHARNMCLSYAELRVRRPLAWPGFKE